MYVSMSQKPGKGFSDNILTNKVIETLYWRGETCVIQTQYLALRTAPVNFGNFFFFSRS